MRVPVAWLREFIDLPTGEISVIRTALESLGHEVEGVDTYEVGWSDVDVAEVLNIDDHPDADRVRICSVTTGGDPITVVCGAFNFEAGALVAFAKPGAVLPGDFAIGTRTIRGVESHGMICSERELELGDDHAGILVLDVGTPIGIPFADVVEAPDAVFDLSITPNRPDAMSMLGIARDLGAYFGVAFRVPDVSHPTIEGSPTVSVDIEDPTGCFRFTVREIREVSVGPSPFWLRQRLRKAGLRPISNAVDVTNYVMLELGHPLHAFDADRVEEELLVVRRAEPDETLVTLDGVRRSLKTEDLVIADANGATSLAGTMGGASSEVHQGTTRILLEAASWDPPTIMRMSRAHGLRSEASARFERGVDPELPATASARASKLLAATSGGEVLSGIVDVVAVEYVRPVIHLTVEDVTRILGDGFSAAGIEAQLVRLHLEVEPTTDGLDVTIPGFRPDLIRPIDLVEEVARLHGYDRFPDTVPTGAFGGWSDEQRHVHAIIDVLVGVGLSEALHLSFMSPSDLDAFAFPFDHEARQVVRVRNPLREEEALLRTTLLPSLLESMRSNRSHGLHEIALFEIGSVFYHRPSTLDPRIPHQPRRLAWVIGGGLVEPSIWNPDVEVDAHTSAAILDLIKHRLGITRTGLQQSQTPGFHPGRSATVIVDGTALGTIGEIHPATGAAYGLTGRISAAEIDLDALTSAASGPSFRTPSTYPLVEFDLAFVVDTDLPAIDVVAATSNAASDLLESAHVFDEYLGLEGDRRSLAIRYVLRAPDRTLTNEEVAPVRQAMIDAGERTGATLRGGA